MELSSCDFQKDGWQSPVKLLDVMKRLFDTPTLNLCCCNLHLLSPVLLPCISLKNMTHLINIS